MLDRPGIDDGPAFRRLARRAGTLDVNPPYAYLLWCRDFAATSVIARRDGAPVGFVTGFRRPAEPDALFVWQVAVDPAERGRGVAAAMLDDLVDRLPVRHVEATVTPDNAASQALFTALAGRHGAPLARTPLFDAEQLGATHAPEFLFRIGPIDRSGGDRPAAPPRRDP